MKTETAWRHSMEALYKEFHKNMEKSLDIILTWISLSENRKCPGRFGKEFKNLGAISGLQADKWILVINNKSLSFRKKDLCLNKLINFPCRFNIITVCHYGSRK
jgi:hypothetical protein